MRPAEPRLLSRLANSVLAAACLSAGVFAPAVAQAQQYGLDTLQPIGKYLDGSLPSTTPGVNGVAQPPALLSQLGAFSNLATLTPRAGLISYTVNSPLWTDGASKQRWMAVPNDGVANTAAEKITFSETGAWQFPKGAVLVKEFDLPVDERNPSVLRRMETRFLVHGEDDVYYGVTYRWRADGSDADLLPDGDSADVTVTTSTGATRQQTWTFPSRADCRTCHNAGAGTVLGPRTHQLNGLLTYPATGRSDNQLRTLNHLGLFTPALSEAAIPGYAKSVAVTDASASLETRVRSYLDANCAHCHRPGNLAVGFDARLATPLAQQNLVNGTVLYDLGLTNARIIAPQSPANSVLQLRLNTVGLHQMPPIGRNTIDTAAISTLTAWINSLPVDNGSGSANRAPLAANDSATTPVNTAVTVDVLGNDSDPDNDPLTVSSVTAPAAGAGTTALSGNAIRYTPAGGFSGTAAFSYTVTDGHGGTGGASVTVQVLAPASANGVVFADNSTRLSAPTWASGVAMGVVDMNADGMDDIVHLKNGFDLRIDYQPASSTAKFTSRDIGTVSSSPQWGLCIGDVDNNGYPDVMTGGYNDGLALFRASAGATSYPRTTLATPSIFAQAIGFVDMNRDGWLDIFACHDDAESAKFRNNGNGTFTADAGLIDTRTSPVSDNSGNYGIVWTDYDNDGDVDLYLSKCRKVATSFTDPRRINQLFRNNGNGTFTNVAAAAGLALGDQSWVADFGDIDNDGDMDCFVGNHGSASRLFRNNGNGTFTDITAAAGLSSVTWRVIQSVFRDLNNDGWTDLLLTGEQHAFWINDRDGTFTKLADSSTLAMESCAVGDLNRDGFTDIYAGYASLYNTPSTARPDKLLLAQPNGNHFLSLTLRGVASNATGSGARIELYGPWGQQVREVRSGEGYGITHSFTQIFGMGNTATADRLRVRWPSGAVDEAWNVTADQFMTLREGSTAAPSLTSPGNRTGTAGDAVSLALAASDPTGDALAFSATGLPAGLTLHPATGAVSGTLTTAGTSAVTVSVTDGWSSVSRSFTWTVNPAATAPTAALTTAAGSVSGPFDVTATFSATVTGLTLSDFVLTNGSASSLAGSGNRWTVRITPAAAGTVTISLPAGAVTANGLGNTASNVLPVSYSPADTTRPGLTLTTPTATVSGAFPVTATFTEAITGLTLSDFALTNGAASALSGSGSVWTFTVTPAAYGAVTVQLPAGRVTDAAGNTNTASATLTATWPQANRAPVVATPPAQSSVRGATVSLTISASDPDGNTLTYSATSLPAGLSISSSTGLISGTVSATAAASQSARVTVSDGALSTVVTFAWSTTPPQLTNGLRGEYYDGLTPGAAAPLLTRLDASIAFDWGSGSPDPLVPADNFSVRWTGEIQPGFTDNYHFVIPSDNGVRLWVNNQLIIDQWLPVGTGGWFEGTIALQAEVRVPVKIEYYEQWGGAGLTTFWYGETQQGWEIIPTERLYPPGSSDTTAPTITLSAASPVTGPFTVSAVFSEAVSGLTASDFALTRGTAGALSGSGTTWSLTVNPTGNPVVITLPAGACTDLAGNASTVSNTLSITWNEPANRPPVLTSPGAQTSASGQGISLALSASDPDGNALTFSASGLPAGLTVNAASGVISGIITAAPGTFAPVLTVRDTANASAAVTFPWTVTPAQLSGLRGEYYAGLAPGDPTAALLLRTDATIDFDWGNGSPDPAVPADNFSVRWTGQVKPGFTDTYHIVIPSDNGLRVWIDNQLIIDQWLPQGTGGWFEGAVPLQADVLVPIRIEYYEEWGGAGLSMYWYGESQQSWELVPSARLYPPGTGVAGALLSLPQATDQMRNSVRLEDAGNGTLDFCYTRTPAFSEICRCVIEVSTDLQHWGPVSTGATETQLAGGIIEVRLTDIRARFGNSPRIWLRVRLEEP